MNPETTPAAGYTPPAGSLEEASSRLMGLLSDTPSEDQQPATAQPEQAPKKKEPTAAEPEQAPAAPDADGETDASESEPAKSPDEEKAEDAPQPPPVYTVKIDGQDVEVTLEEALKGYSRTQDYTRKTQQLADERKRFEAEDLAAVRAERHQYQTELGTLKSAIEALVPTEPDWEKRRTEVAPDVFAAEVLQWQQRQKAIEKIDAERARIKALEDADAEKGFRAYLADQQTRLETVLPEFKDPEKATVTRRELSEFAKGLGFTDDELGQVTDHRLVVLLHKAMQYDKAQQAKPKIANKIEQTLTTAAPGNRNPAPKPSKLDQAKSRLQRSGRIEDAAAALAELI